MRSNDSRFLGAIPLRDYYGHARWIFFSRDFDLSDEQGISEAILVDSLGSHRTTNRMMPALGGMLNYST